MQRLRCLTWRLRTWRLPHEWQHRAWQLPTWQHRIWQHRISPQRHTGQRPISLHRRATWPCRMADHALPPRMGHLTPLLAAHLVMKLPTLQRVEVSRAAEELQQRVRNNASAPSAPRASSNTVQGARRRLRRAPLSVEGPMLRVRPLWDGGAGRTVVKPLAKPRPGSGKTRLASREIRATCHAWSSARASSAGHRSFETRCSQASSRPHEGGGQQKRSRNRRSEAISRSRPCMIVAIATIAV